MSTLLDSDYTNRQATYDLRRLRRKGLIVRIPGTFRYQLTPDGRRVAVLFTKTYGRVLTPGLAACDLAVPDEIAQRSPLAVAWRRPTANSIDSSTGSYSRPREQDRKLDSTVQVKTSKWN